MKTKKLMIGAALAVLAASTPMVAHAADMTNLSPAMTHTMTAQDPLAGTEWELVAPTYNGLKEAPVLKFEGGRISASVGLNSIGGEYDLGRHVIEIGPLLSTKMAGPQPLMNAENIYAKSLESVRGYQLSANGQTLTLRGDQTLTFRKTSRASQSMGSARLAGTHWKLISPGYAGLETAPFLKFSDKRLNASVGLNAINGDYQTDGQKMNFGPLLSTKMAGPQPLMNAENAYSKALNGVRSYEISRDGKTLILRGAQTLTFQLAPEMAMADAILANTKWELITPIYAGLKTAPTLMFLDGRINASVGLNSIQGSYETDRDGMNLGALLSTKMAGPQPLMNAENSYSKALNGVRSFQLSEDARTLTLRGDQTLTFRRAGNAGTEYDAPSANFANTEWALTSPRYAGLKEAPILKFADKRINASVGLNSIQGSYQIDGREINFGPLLSTKMAGPRPLMNAEISYARALESARSYALSADGRTLTLRGDENLTFRLTGKTASGFAATETKILNVAPQLGAQMDGDKALKYLQLEDLSEGVSWGRFTEARILGFNFVPGNRYQLRVAVERDARSGEKRLRLLDVISQQWMKNVKLAANHQILEVAPTKVDCGGAAAMQCLQVRQPRGKWMTLRTPIQGFNFQEGSRYRLQVAVTRVAGKPANAANARYTLVRVLDKMPVTF